VGQQDQTHPDQNDRAKRSLHRQHRQQSVLILAAIVLLGRWCHDDPTGDSR
jgi:hypothetical protein